MDCGRRIRTDGVRDGRIMAHYRQWITAVCNTGVGRRVTAGGSRQRCRCGRRITEGTGRASTAKGTQTTGWWITRHRRGRDGLRQRRRQVQVDYG